MRCTVIGLLFAAALCAQRLPDLQPDKIWLDSKAADGAPKIWNRSGRSIPHAPRGGDIDELCKGRRYQVQTDEEKAVAKAGWVVFGKTNGGQGVVIVGGQSFNDGMCRPMQFQEFVFVHGQYAGTLSPARMDSREDGSFYRVFSWEGGEIHAEFERYSEKDSRCCPSRVSQVIYDIRDEAGKPVVVAKSVKTRSAE